MNRAQDILDAIGYIDDDLLEDVDRIRRKPPQKPIILRRIGVIAAAVALIFVSTLTILGFKGFLSAKSNGTGADDAECSQESTNIGGTPDDGAVAEDVYLYTDEHKNGNSLPGPLQTVNAEVMGYQNDNLVVRLLNRTDTFKKDEIVHVVFNGMDPDDYPVDTLLKIQYTVIDEQSDPAVLYARFIKMLPTE